MLWMGYKPRLCGLRMSAALSCHRVSCVCTFRWVHLSSFVTSSVLTGVSRLMLPNSAKHQNRISLSEVSARHFCLMSFFALTWSVFLAFVFFLHYCRLCACCNIIVPYCVLLLLVIHFQLRYSIYQWICLSSSMCNFWIVVLLEFRAQEGRDPDIDHADADADKLKEIASEVLKSLGIREDWLDLDFTAYVILSGVFLKWYVQVQLFVAWYNMHCHCQPWRSRTY